MIDKKEQSYLKDVVHSQAWGIIQRLATLYCDKIKRERIVKDTEWDTIKSALYQEGQIEGIKKFIAELYELGK